MCGIVAAIGTQKVMHLIVKGLKMLEYRGYDSAGIALNDGKTSVYKKQGKVAALEAVLPKSSMATVGIGHTRWATHGKPSDLNSHPHRSQSGRITLVHNGIIENYKELTSFLVGKGFSIISETDTEVLAHLIEYYLDETTELANAVRMALKKVEGSFAVIIMDANNPDQLIASRWKSPLVVGTKGNNVMMASDVNPLKGQIEEAYYLNEREVIVINKDSSMVLTDMEGNELSMEFKPVPVDTEEISKGNFSTFMEKEIHEQPRSLINCMKGRFFPEKGKLRFTELEDHTEQLLKTTKITIAACGTSWHAALVAEYFFEKYARIATEVEYASEYRYREPVFNDGDYLIAISQSGETADTIAAIELAKENKVFTHGIVNTRHSTIERLTNVCSSIEAGAEIGVASTKAFTNQVLTLGMMALYIGHLKGTIDAATYKRELFHLKKLPLHAEMILSKAEECKQIAEVMANADNAMFLGRGMDFPLALEGALKLKELSYKPAEGYAAGEMKHGPIALVDENLPIIALATNSRTYGKTLSNIEEVSARGGKIFSIVSEGDEVISKISELSVSIPYTSELWKPILAAIPLQFLAYYTAVFCGNDVDQPRNLAKSVTVE